MEYKKRSNWPFLPEMLDNKPPAWRLEEDRKARANIVEYCQEQVETFNEIKILNILNTIQTISDEDEYKKLK